MRRLPLIALLIAIAAAAFPTAAAAADTPRPRPTPRVKIALTPIDYLSLIGYGGTAFYWLSACGTPAGCMASLEMQKLYAMDAKLDQLVAGMGQLQASVDDLTRVTNAGFRQLNVDLKQSRYAMAEANLTELTSDTEEAFQQLRRTTNPELSAKERTDAYRNFVAYARQLDGSTFEILQKVGGDPATPQSQTGVLPAAWDVLMASETQRQQSTIGGMPPFLPWQVQAQMRSLGNLWVDRELKLAQVLSTYAAVTAPTQEDGKRRSDEVLRRFERGGASHPGIPNQLASLPKPLPVGTGLFTGKVTGDPKLPGLVMGNFSAWRQPEEGGPLLSADAGWGLKQVGYYDTTGTSAAATDDTRDFGSFRYDAVSGEVSETSTGACLWVPRATAGERVFLDPCAAHALRRWNYTGGRLRLRGATSLCLVITEYPLGWQNQRAAWIGLRPCDDDPGQMWFLDGPTPTWNAPPDPRIGTTGFAGSPRGDNPEGSGPWPAAWRYPTPAWMKAVGESIRSAGSSAGALAQVFSLPSVAPETRILGPYLRVGLDFQPRRITFPTLLPASCTGGTSPGPEIGVQTFDDLGVFDDWVCRSAGPTPSTLVTKVQPCDYEYVKYRTADPTRVRADGTAAACDTTLSLTIETGPTATSPQREATGSVEIVPTQRSCGASCSQTFAIGTTTLLIADPGVGSRFAGWSGACSGSDDDCAVSMHDARRVTARFVAAPDVGVTVDPAAHGRITSLPVGIDCGESCTATFRYNERVTFSAIPDPGYRLAQWTGTCAGTASTCVLIVDDRVDAIGASFVPVDRPSPPTPGPGDTPPAPAPINGPNPPRPFIGPNPVGKLALTQLRASRRVFRPGLGTVISYRLNENADVTMTFTLLGNPKVRHVYRLKRGRKGGDAGHNYVFLSGRAGTRYATAGAWRMTIRATNRNGSSRLLKLPLRVVAP